MLTIRPATASDYPAFAKMFPELKTPDPTPSPATWERDLVPTTSIVEVDGAACGYCYVQTLAEAGYVRHLVVAPEGRGKGLGRALMNAAQSTFRAAGAREMHLNVDPTNTPAVRLYESLGLRTMYETRAVRFDWSLVDRLPPKAGGHGRELGRDEHAVFEAHFDMPRGLLDAQLAREGVCIIGLADEAGAPLGVAAFNPPFPGAFPFKVAHEDWARPLLEAMRPRRSPLHAELQLVIESQPALADRLVAEGARVVLDIVHMQGPIESEPSSSSTGAPPG